MTSPAAFRRIVLGLDQAGSDRAVIRFAADFARLLRLDLFGLFAEDPSLARLAALPSLREFRLLERQWQPIEGRSLSADLERCVAVARQSFEDIARATGVARRFEVVQARTLEALASVSSESDIVVVAEPRPPAPPARETFSEAVAAALATPAGVLVVPSRIVRTHGSILAISETADDESVSSAAAIAAAAEERIDVHAVRDYELWQRSQPVGQAGERLIVMTRRTSARLAPFALVAQRRVPVLVLGRAQVAAGTDETATPQDR